MKLRFFFFVFTLTFYLLGAAENIAVIDDKLMTGIESYQTCKSCRKTCSVKLIRAVQAVLDKEILLLPQFREQLVEQMQQIITEGNIGVVGATGATGATGLAGAIGPAGVTGATGATRLRRRRRQPLDERPDEPWNGATRSARRSAVYV